MRKFLLVDDDEGDLILMAMALEEFGVRSDKCQDAFKAASCIINGKYDGVIIDHRMPIISGPELARMLRKIYKGPIYISSVHSKECIGDKLQEAGISPDMFISKNDLMENLMAIVSEKSCH